MRFHTTPRAVTALAAAFAASAVAGTSRAATVVSFGGDVVSVNRSLAGTTTTDTSGNFGGTAAPDARVTRAFSETVALSPPALEYSGPRFFGGYQATAFDTSTAPTFNARVSQSGAADRIFFDYTPTAGGAGGQFHNVVAFLKPDFTGVGPSDSVTMMSAADSLTVTVQFADPNATATAGRFLIRNGPTFYLSNATFPATGPQTLTNPSSATTFAAYDPAAGLDFNPATATFAPITFNDVTGVGYYFENENIPAGTIFRDYVTQVTANATVPEPAAAGATCLAAAAGLLARRRRA